MLNDVFLSLVFETSLKDFVQTTEKMSSTSNLPTLDDEKKAQPDLELEPGAARAPPTLMDDGSGEDEGFLTIPTLTDADVQEVLEGQSSPPGFPPLSYDEEELGDIVSRRRAAARALNRGFKRLSVFCKILCSPSNLSKPKICIRFCKCRASQPRRSGRRRQLR